MDWYLDFIMLFTTFCVIAIGMTIYVRRHPAYSRYHKYVYTGLIPTITITTCEDMPSPVLVPSSEEDSENEPNGSEDSCSSTQENQNTVDHPQTACLTVPVLDDDYDEDEEVEIKMIETVPLIESSLEEEKQNVIVSHPEEDEEEEKTTSELENHVYNLMNEDIIDKLDDDTENLIEVQLVSESPPKKSHYVNGFTWKYGTSHTVEDPLFPFSEALDDDEPLIKNRPKKRLSQ